MTGEEFSESVRRAMIAAIDADPRTQEQIAVAAWPDLRPASALQRIYRARSGAWMPPETAAAIARALNLHPGTFYQGT